LKRKKFFSKKSNLPNSAYGSLSDQRSIDIEIFHLNEGQIFQFLPNPGCDRVKVKQGEV